MLSTGCYVTDVGISLTPIIHFLTCIRDFDAGVEVTASHNPKEFNGFRLDYSNALSFHESDILNLHEISSDESYVSGVGKLFKQDLSQEYIDFIKSHFAFSTELKVLLNCGHGTSSYFVGRFFSELGVNFETVFCSPDSSFPLGTPDPERVDFMQIFAREIKKTDATVGFTFDTDCDRFGVIDCEGTVYSNDKMIWLLSKNLLKRSPGATIAFDVKCSGVLEDAILEWGGNPKRIKTGHPYHIDELKKGALLSGEFSGHMFVGDPFFGYDDGLLAACKVLEVLEEEKSSLKDLFSGYPKRVSTPEIKMVCPDEKKFKIIDEITKKVQKMEKHFLQVEIIDGVRVKITQTGWFLIRASNTSPYLSIRAEGIDSHEVALLLSGVKDLLSKYSFLDLASLQV